MRFELFGLEIQMKNLDIVSKSPLVDVRQMQPTRINEMCCDQKTTLMLRPNQ